MATKSDKRGARPRRGEPPAAAEEAPAAARPSMLTSFRLYSDQIGALGQVSQARRQSVGGRADQAGVLRELLEALADGKDPPADLREALKSARERWRNSAG
jgi:hypothetical protein